MPKGLSIIITLPPMFINVDFRMEILFLETSQFLFKNATNIFFYFQPLIEQIHPIFFKLRLKSFCLATIYQIKR